MTIQHFDLYDNSQNDDTPEDPGYVELRDSIRQILDRKSSEIHDLNLGSNAGRLILARIIAESLKNTDPVTP